MPSIRLNNGQEVLVDDEDISWLKVWRWKFIAKKSGGGYAFRDIKDPLTGKWRQRLMHREIMKAPRGMLVDHIDGDSLNNQKSNLRLVTPTQNQQNQTASRKDNTSGVKGVSWSPSKKAWRVSITVNGVHKTLAYVETLEEGRDLYNQTALAEFGPFARLNEVG